VWLLQKLQNTNEIHGAIILNKILTDQEVLGMIVMLISFIIIQIPVNNIKTCIKKYEHVISISVAIYILNKPYIATDTIIKLKKQKNLKLNNKAFIHSDQEVHYNSPTYQSLLFRLFLSKVLINQHLISNAH